MVNVHGSIQAYPPKDLIDKRDSERKEDANAHKTERKEDRALELKKCFWKGSVFSLSSPIRLSLAGRDA